MVQNYWWWFRQGTHESCHGLFRLFQLLQYQFLPFLATQPLKKLMVHLKRVTLFSCYRGPWDLQGAMMLPSLPRQLRHCPKPGSGNPVILYPPLIGIAQRYDSINATYWRETRKFSNAMSATSSEGSCAESLLIRIVPMMTRDTWLFKDSDSFFLFFEYRNMNTVMQ